MEPTCFASVTRFGPTSNTSSTPSCYRPGIAISIVLTTRRRTGPRPTAKRSSPMANIVRSNGLAQGKSGFVLGCLLSFAGAEYTSNHAAGRFGRFRFLGLGVWPVNRAAPAHDLPCARTHHVARQDRALNVSKRSSTGFISAHQSSR